MCGHSIFCLAGMGRKHLTTTVTAAGREGEPRSEMMTGTPSTQIRAAFRDQPQSQVRDAVIDMIAAVFLLIFI